MNNNNLLNELKKITNLLTDNYNLFSGIQQSSFFNSEITKDIINCIEVEYPELYIFNNHLQYFVNGGSDTSYIGLIHWLIKHSFQTSCETAINDFYHYLSNDIIKGYLCILLTGIRVNKIYEFNNDIILSPINKLPDSYLLNEIIKSNNSIIPIDQIHSVLLKNINTNKLHISNTSNEKVNYCIPSHNDLEDFRLLLTLGWVRGYGVQAIAYSFCVKDNIPILEPYRWSRKNYRSTIINPEFIKIYAHKINKFYNNFIQMSNFSKNKLRITLLKLNDLTSTYNVLQVAIDLRTSFESFLTKKNEDRISKVEFSKRIVALSKKFNFKKCIEIDDAKLVYKICSEAIHTGSINSKYNNNIKLLNDFASILRLFISNVIDNKIELPLTYQYNNAMDNALIVL